MQVSPSISFAASLLGSSGYMTVSLSMTGRAKSEQVLRIILDRADDIIRQEQLRDVKARIAYINSELPNITASEQRLALIQILSSQEELKTMMVADHRYASTLVDPPAAPPLPSSPMSPGKAFLASLFLALVALAALVGLGERVHFLSRFIARFQSSRQRQGGQQESGSGRREPAPEFEPLEGYSQQ